MGSKLLNPGSGEPTHLDFTEWPHLAEFFASGGTPGVEYLYLCPEEVPRAKREGWDTIVRMPYFTVGGIDLTAVARGEPIPGVRPGSSVCKVHVSNLAQERCKLDVKLAAEPDATDKLNEAIAAAKSRHQAQSTPTPAPEPQKPVRPSSVAG